MAVTLVTFTSTLMAKAAAVGRARRSGDPDALAGAERDLQAYEQLCLKAERMILDVAPKRFARWSR